MKTQGKMSRNTAICAAILIMVLALFLIGAQRIQADIRAQQQAQQRTQQQVMSWHRQIASELPLDQQATWQDHGQVSPIQLLRACAIEVRLVGDVTAQ